MVTPKLALKLMGFQDCPAQPSHAQNADDTRAVSLLRRH
jgi:hypothetical protein